MELTQKQKNFYNTLNKWQLTHDNMSIIDLCALIEYQTKLRCLIEADLDTPFDYDEVRYLLEDYGYDMPKDDNKILDKAFQITENLINGLENDIKIFRTLTNEEKFEHELQANNITMEDKINLYNEYYKKLNENKSVEVPEEIAYNITMKCYTISGIILCISLIIMAVCIYSLTVK